MRSNPTEAEAIFWELVRGRKICGKKFHRQYPIKLRYENRICFFFADFYCPEISLIIEIDGGIHQFQEDYDTLRTHLINELGKKVIRFSNEDVLNNIRKIINILETEINPGSPHVRG